MYIRKTWAKWATGAGISQCTTPRPALVVHRTASLADPHASLIPAPTILPLATPTNTCPVHYLHHRRYLHLRALPCILRNASVVLKLVTGISQQCQCSINTRAAVIKGKGNEKCTEFEIRISITRTLVPSGVP